MARGAARVARIERQVHARPVAAERQPRLRRELEIDAHAPLLLRVVALLVEVEAGPRARVAEGHRVVLVLVVGEVVDPILLDRAAIGEAQLLILVRQHAVLHEVLRDEAVVAEVAGDGARRNVGARLRDGVDLHAHRAPLAGVEAVRDELELRDRVAAELRLAERLHHVVGHFLAVDVQLEVPRAAHRRVARCVLPRSGREHRQINPVPAVERQVLHLARVDVGADRGAHRVDERRFAGDRHRFLHRGRRELQVQHRRLAHEQIDTARHGGKSRQLRGDAMHARAHGQTESAGFIGHGHERIARRFVNRGNRHAGQHAARRVGNRAGHGRILREGARRQQQNGNEKQRGEDESPE